VYSCYDEYAYHGGVHDDEVNGEGSVKVMTLAYEQHLRDSKHKCSESVKPVKEREYTYLVDGSDSVACYKKKSDDNQYRPTSFHRAFDIPCVSEPLCYTVLDVEGMEERQMDVNDMMLKLCLGVAVFIVGVWLLFFYGPKKTYDANDDDDDGNDFDTDYSPQYRVDANGNYVVGSNKTDGSSRRLNMDIAVDGDTFNEGGVPSDGKKVRRHIRILSRVNSFINNSFLPSPFRVKRRPGSGDGGLGVDKGRQPSSPKSPKSPKSPRSLKKGGSGHFKMVLKGRDESEVL
jgi:hypothetical protein